ncbi:MAG: hypothetical protein FWE03_06500 [Firmicutes bacterium]|nr:hypothetical protein [Bacillota bacterium]
MLNCFNFNLCNLTECDVLSLNTLITREIMCKVKDTDSLNLLGDLFSAIGANLNMLANRRQYLEENIEN